MLETISIAGFQFFEETKQSGFKNAFRKTFFINSEIVPVTKDLGNVKPANEFLEKCDLRMISVTLDDILHFNYYYRFKSRLLKAKRNLISGLKAFALVSNTIIVGEIWYVTWGSTHHPHLHDDVDLLFLEPGKKDVYMFDMFIDPLFRGKNIASGLMGSALYNLRQDGYQNAFGFFELKNIPALWTHRMLKFKELDHVYFSRFFLKRFSRKIPFRLRNT